MVVFLFFFFFFQAEDGIRDLTVTGVQTCALPISDLMIVVAYGLLLPPKVLAIPTFRCWNVHASLLPRWRGAAPIQRAIEARSEERRVGKECRSRWWAYPEKKKTNTQNNTRTAV